jgi:hypothetical protein
LLEDEREESDDETAGANAEDDPAAAGWVAIGEDKLSDLGAL